MNKVYIGGTFDLLHPGHINLLKVANRIGIVIVAVNTDEFVSRFKNKKTVMKLEERIEVLKACRYVDVVDVNEGCEDSKPTILRNKPDFILRGSDWSDDEGYMKQLGITKDFLIENNINLLCTPYFEGVSTTLLKQRFTIV